MPDDPKAALPCDGDDGDGAAASASAEGPAPSLPPYVSELLARRLGGLTFCVADCGRADMPIVYASPAFLELTGYREDEVLGRNCRFMNGPATEARKLMEIRDAIREERPCQVCLLNYKKGGEPFWNQLHLSPLKAPDGRVTHYIGVQADVTEIVAAGQAARAAAGKGAAAGGAPSEAAGACELDPAAERRLEEERRRLEAVLDLAPDATLDTPLESDAPKAAAAPLASRLAPALSGDVEAGAGPAVPPGAAAAAVAALGQSDDSEEGVEEVEDDERWGAAQVAEVLEEAGLPAGAPAAAAGPLPMPLQMALLPLRGAFVLCDPRLPDCPVVFASDDFCRLTGYAREEVLGHNLRLLQGPGSEGPELDALRAALARTPMQPVTATLLNYRKGGAPFWCSLHAAPVRDAGGGVEFWVGAHIDATLPQAPGPSQEPQHAPESAAGSGPRPPPGPAPYGLAQKLAHDSLVAAVRVAARALSGAGGGLLRSAEDQTLLRRGSAGGDGVGAPAG